MRPLTRVASRTAAVLIVATESSWSRPPSQASGASPAYVADLDGYVTLFGTPRDLTR